MTNGYYHLRTTLLGVDLGFEDDFNYFLLPLYFRSVSIQNIPFGPAELHSTACSLNCQNITLVAYYKHPLPLTLRDSIYQLSDTRNT